ncbi:sugar ABC transporter substrate-binding protein [Pectobacterium cacticida]|uniref:sugar ABC transporter substrate-binding protein n=1 Tax=Pectobacterium cacticida TaxID=69221 RepID=UPI002FF37E70
MKKVSLPSLLIPAVLLISSAPLLADELSLTPEEHTPMTCDITLDVNHLAQTKIAKSSKPYTLAFSVPSYANPYVQALLYGAQQAANEAGVKLSVTAGKGFMDPASQITQLENALSRRPDAVLINPSDPDGLAQTIDEIIENGTPVIDVGTLSNSEQSWKLVQDDYTQGVMAAEALAKQNLANGKGIIMGGPANASWARRRVAGFMDTLQKYPNLQIAAVVSSDIDPQQGLTKFVNAAQANPQFGWIYATGSFLLAPQSIPVEYQNAVYVAGGLTNVTEDALRQNKITAVLPDFPIATGYYGVKMAIDILEKRPPLKRICAPVAAMTVSDLSDPVWSKSSILPSDFKPLD